MTDVLIKSIHAIFFQNQNIYQILKFITCFKVKHLRVLPSGLTTVGNLLANISRISVVTFLCKSNCFLSSLMSQDGTTFGAELEALPILNFTFRKNLCLNK